MTLSTLITESLDEMDRSVDLFGVMVPEPQATPFQDGFVYRYVEKSIEQAIVQKLARIPSGLRAAHILLEAGYFQEQGILQRVVDELQEDVMFLCIPTLFGDIEPIHEKYLEAFYAEEFDFVTGLPTAQDRPMVRRKKIRAYIARSPIGTGDPSGHVEATRTITKAYSGFVHAASPHIMDMYGGQPARFHTMGMLGTDREPEHRRDIINYYYRSLTAFVAAARALDHQQQYDRLFELFRRYEIEMELRNTP